MCLITHFSHPKLQHDVASRGMVINRAEHLAYFCFQKICNGVSENWLSSFIFQLLVIFFINIYKTGKYIETFVNNFCGGYDRIVKYLEFFQFFEL